MDSSTAPKHRADPPLLVPTVWFADEPRPARALGEWGDVWAKVDQGMSIFSPSKEAEKINTDPSGA